MTGRRRRRREKPLRIVAATQRSRAHLNQRITTATRPRDRVAAAAAYLVAVLARADHQLAARAADQTTAALIDAAERIDAATVAAVTRRVN